MKILLKIILFISEFEEILYDLHIHYHWDYNFTHQLCYNGICSTEIIFLFTDEDHFCDQKNCRLLNAH